MKRIKLIKTEIRNTRVPKDFVLDYRTEFLTMIETVPEGMTVSQMGVAIKIADKLHNPDRDHIYLEDAEWEYLRSKASSWKFGIIAPEIVAMVAAVENAETVETVLREPESIVDVSQSRTTKKAGA